VLEGNTAPAEVVGAAEVAAVVEVAGR